MQSGILDGCPTSTPQGMRSSQYLTFKVQVSAILFEIHFLSLLLFTGWISLKVIGPPEEKSNPVISYFMSLKCQNYNLLQTAD